MRIEPADIGKLEVIPEGLATEVRVPSRVWPRPSQMRAWLKGGQETEGISLKRLSRVAKEASQVASPEGRIAMLSSCIPERLTSIPAACEDATGEVWNLLDMAILSWDESALRAVLSKLDQSNELIRQQMGETLTRSHRILNRGKMAGLPYMPIESKFSRSLLSLVSCGANVEKSYWYDPASAVRLHPRGVFGNGEDVSGIVFAAVHTLPDKLAAPAIKNLALQGYEIDRITQNDRSSPLHLACRRGMLETIETLLDLGANPDRKANNGWKADSFAKAGKNSDVIQMLDAFRAKLVIQRALSRVSAVPR